MKYKEFVKWCNERAADGCWDINAIRYCYCVMQIINAYKWPWKKQRVWHKEYERDIVSNIVDPLDCKRKQMYGRVQNNE